MDKELIKKTMLVVSGETVLNTPNDAELGEKIRQLFYEAREVKIYENKNKKDAINNL